MEKLNEYMEHLKEKNYCKNTLESYLRNISNFFKYMGKVEATNRDIELYKQHLLSKKLKPVSINNYLVIIRDFLLWTGKKDVKIRMIMQQKPFTLENLITTEEVKKIIEAAKEARDARAVALIFGYYATGMRASELLAVRVEQVMEGQRVIDVPAKGGKIRKIMFPEDLQRVCKRYIKERSMKDTDLLFTGSKGAISRKTALEILKQYGKVAGVEEEKLFLHNLRHRFAVNLLTENKGDVATVARWLGHRNTKTVEIYLQKSLEENLKDVQGFLFRV